MTQALDQLLDNARIAAPPTTAAISVNSVVYYSGRAIPGSLFVAIAGARADGHDYAARAVAAGAVAVVGEYTPSPELPAGIPLILVKDSRVALSALAAAINGRPSQQLAVVGITGTDGKTTTTTMTWAALRAAGISAGALTTVDSRYGDIIETNSTRQTTQEATELQAQLRRMVDADCRAAAIETSSHALEMHRVDDVDYRVAVFTRITSEHLDLHGDREAYRAAKARLIGLTARRDDGVAVLDADDDFGYPMLRDMPIARRLSYSATGHEHADLRATGVHADSAGVHYLAATPWGETQMDLQLAGTFNVSNSLAALAAACSVGATLEDAARGINALDRVSGRMERVLMGQDFSVIVDYAHTADALAKVLTELRAATSGRLWVVFGSAGERDHAKRPAMGAVAARLADIAVITDEDPREEDRDEILEAIAAGAIGAGGRRGVSIQVIADRHQAIDYAIANAAPGDTVLLAGKGHETCIIVGHDNVPYSERAAAETSLRARTAP